MRKFAILAMIAGFTFTSLTDMAAAATINPANRNHLSETVGSAVVAVDYYYGQERRHYRKKRYYDEEQEHCYWKKVRHYDEYGQVYYERVRICS